LILGAFFMATDYTTAPLTSKGRIIFAAGCGAVTFLIRRFGGYPEGVSFAILFMNLLTPYIDKVTRTTPLGTDGVGSKPRHHDKRRRRIIKEV
jgi:electron transport complex protein RnfD